jgi:Fic family protein
MDQFSEKLVASTDKFCASQKSDVQRLRAALQLASFAAGSLIQIHPLLNGNGRMARLTANFYFNRYGFKMPFYIDRP